MYIESIRLRDWKSYVQESFTFPKPTANKNVVLIGAENGFGKTSLLEALMLCLYGRDGLAHIPRATIVDGDESKLTLSYDDFLRRALHGFAIESGRSSASIAVTLNDDGSRYEIFRVWHFQGNGKHLPSDEEVRISIDGEPFRAGKLDDKIDAFRHLIAKLFVPVYLAPFFLFDGEQVQRLAQKDMAAQVKTGIEGLLGVGTLRELQADLRNYVTNRKQAIRGGDSSALDIAEQALADYERDSDEANRKIKSLEPTLRSLREQTESKNRLLHAIAGGNSASIKELNEAHSRAENQRSRLRDRLSEFLRADLAVSIAGKELHGKLTRRLEAEEALERWTASKEQGRDQFVKLRGVMNDASPEPPLTVSQNEWLASQLERAWESIWFPPPSGCADSIRHTMLAPRERTYVMSRTATLRAIGLGDIQDLVNDYTNAEQELIEAEGRVRNLSSVEEQATKAAEELRVAMANEETAKGEHREVTRHADTLKGQISQKRAEVERARESFGRSQPLQNRIQRAIALANAIDLMISDMYPLKVDEVAQAMTAIYKKLAHKKLLDQVAISPDCEVQLLDKRGNDLRRYDASAGESQIFAIALITAIAKVSGADIPIIVDTPLARLDERHRTNVLKHLASLPSQVILLSATDEVSGQYYDAIRGRVNREYLLEFEELDGAVGISKAKLDYWRQPA